MNEAGLFVAGVAVSGVVFTGGFLYVMFSFTNWADREEAKTPPRPKKG